MRGFIATLVVAISLAAQAHSSTGIRVVATATNLSVDGPEINVFVFNEGDKAKEAAIFIDDNIDLDRAEPDKGIFGCYGRKQKNKGEHYESWPMPDSFLGQGLSSVGVVPPHKVI